MLTEIPLNLPKSHEINLWRCRAATGRAVLKTNDWGSETGLQNKEKDKIALRSVHIHLAFSSELQSFRLRTLGNWETWHIYRKHQYIFQLHTVRKSSADISHRAGSGDSNTNRDESQQSVLVVVFFPPLSFVTTVCLSTSTMLFSTSHATTRQWQI